MRSFKNKYFYQENCEENSIKIIGDLTSNDVKGKKIMKKDKKPLEKILKIKKENENHIRNLNNIHVNGNDVPEPTETFEKLFSTFDIPVTLQNNLLSYRFPEPTPIQMQAFPALLNVRKHKCIYKSQGLTLNLIFYLIRTVK